MLRDLIESSAEEQRIFVIRHGQTQENVERIIQGQHDTHLNAVGKAQAQLAAFALRSLTPDIIISSDLSRCIETRDTIFPQRSCDIETTDLLRERGFGDVEGMTASEAIRYAKSQGKTLDTIGESHENFSDRVKKAWDYVLSTSRGKKVIVVISHGGVISMLVNILITKKKYLLSKEIMTEKLGLPINTSISVLDVGAICVIKEYNNADHLKGNKGPVSAF